MLFIELLSKEYYIDFAKHLLRVDYCHYHSNSYLSPMLFKPKHDFYDVEDVLKRFDEVDLVIVYYGGSKCVEKYHFHHCTAKINFDNNYAFITDLFLEDNSSKLIIDIISFATFILMEFKYQFDKILIPLIIDITSLRNKVGNTYKISFDSERQITIIEK